MDREMGQTRLGLMVPRGAYELIEAAEAAQRAREACWDGVTGLILFTVVIGLPAMLVVFWPDLVMRVVFPH